MGRIGQRFREKYFEEYVFVQENEGDEADENKEENSEERGKDDKKGEDAKYSSSI